MIENTSTRRMGIGTGSLFVSLGLALALRAEHNELEWVQVHF
jgi:hypothetical protein